MKLSWNYLIAVILLGCSSMFPSIGWAQQKSYDKLFFPIWDEKTELWGALDIHENVVIPFRYDRVWQYDWHNIESHFHNLYLLLRNGKYGFMHRITKAETGLIYDDIDDYPSTMALVKRNEKWGCIDAEGKEVVPCIYDEISRIYNSEYPEYYIMKDGLWGCMDSVGNVVMPCVYNDLSYIRRDCWRVKGKNGKFGLINMEGKVILPFDYELISGASNDSILGIKKDNLYGFCSTEGKIIKECQYIHSSHRFYKDLAIVCAADGSHGVIDCEGNDVIPCGKYSFYNWSSDKIFADGPLHVKRLDAQKQDGYLTSQGTEIAFGKYKEYNDFNDGLAIVRGYDEKFKVINTSGLEILSFDVNTWNLSESLLRDWNSIRRKNVFQITPNLIGVECNLKAFIVDASGQRMNIQPYISFFRVSERLTGARLYVDSKNCIQLINSNGEYLEIYDNVGRTVLYVPGIGGNGIISVTKNGKMGYIAADGKVVISPVYKRCTYRESMGVFCVQADNGLWGLLDAHGETVLPVEYDEIDNDFLYGLCRVIKNGKVGFINKEWKEVIPCRYGRDSEIRKYQYLDSISRQDVH